MPKYMSDREWYRRQEEQARQQYLTESAKKKIKDKKAKKEKEEEDEEKAKYLDKSKKEEKVRESYLSFKHRLKDTLLCEAIYNIYSQSVPEQMTECLTKRGMDIESMERGFIEDFVQEQGTPEKILRKWRTKNSFLSEYASIIDSTYEEILESVDKNEPDTYGLPTNTKSQFYSQLSQATPDEVVDTIKSRVMDSINNFLDENREMKNAITDIYGSAQTQNATTDDDAMKESASLRFPNMTEQKIAAVRRNQHLSVFGEMTKLVGKNIVMNEDLCYQYINEETGRIDTDSVVECTAIMYAFLETCNTIKLANVDQEYIEKVFNEMEQSITEAAKKRKKKEKKKKDKEEDSDDTDDKDTKKKDKKSKKDDDSDDEDVGDSDGSKSKKDKKDKDSSDDSSDSEEDLDDSSDSDSGLELDDSDSGGKKKSKK